MDNAQRVTELQHTVTRLTDHLNENKHTINLLKKGAEWLSEESDAIIDYVYEETHRLYQVVEGVRCDSYNRDIHMSARLSLLEYIRYLHTPVTAIMNSALTGALIPKVLGMKRLLAI